MSIRYHEPPWSMDPGGDHPHSLGSVENYWAFVCGGERDRLVKGVPCRLTILGLRKVNLPQKVNSGMKNLQQLPPHRKATGRIEALNPVHSCDADKIFSYRINEFSFFCFDLFV